MRAYFVGDAPLEMADINAQRIGIEHPFTAGVLTLVRIPFSTMTVSHTAPKEKFAYSETRLKINNLYISYIFRIRIIEMLLLFPLPPPFPMFRCKSCHKMDRWNYDIGKGRYDTQTVR